MKNSKILLVRKLIERNIAFEFTPHGDITIGIHAVVFYEGFIYFDNDMSCSDNNENVEKIFDEFIQYILFGDKEYFETILKECTNYYTCAFCGKSYNFWKERMQALVHVEDGYVIGHICPNCSKTVSPYALYKKTGGISRQDLNSQAGEDLRTYVHVKHILD